MKILNILLLCCFIALLVNASDPDEIAYIMKPDEDLLLWPLPSRIQTGKNIINLGDGCSFKFIVPGDLSYSENLYEITTLYSDFIFYNQ